MRVVLLLALALLAAPAAIAAPTGAMTSLDGVGPHFAEPFVAPAADADEPVTLHLVIPWTPSAPSASVLGAAGYSTAYVTFPDAHVDEAVLAAAVLGAALCPVSASAADQLLWRGCVALAEADACADPSSLEPSEYCVREKAPLTLAVELALRTTETALVVELALVGAHVPGESEPFAVRVANDAWGAELAPAEVTFRVDDAGLPARCDPDLILGGGVGVGGEVGGDPIGCLQDAGFNVCDPLDADCAPGPSCASQGFACANAPFAGAAELANPALAFPARVAEEAGEPATPPSVSMEGDGDGATIDRDGTQTSVPAAVPYELRGNDQTDLEVLLDLDQAGIAAHVCLAGANGAVADGLARELRCGGDMDGDGATDLHEVNELSNPAGADPVEVPA